MQITTDKTIGTLKPRDGRYSVRDAKVSGLELRVLPDGSKVWTLRYRCNGEQRGGCDCFHVSPAI